MIANASLMGTMTVPVAVAPEELQAADYTNVKRGTEDTKKDRRQMLEVNLTALSSK